MTDSSPPPSYPEILEIVPLDKPAQATIRVPGSKSITNRALILAALSDPEKGSELQGACQSEDTEIMVAALRDLGFSVRADWARSHIQVRRGPHARIIPASQAELFVGNSGTTMRFLTALVSLGHGRYRLDGVARMRERPMGDLLGALQQLGVKVWSERGNGYPPVVVQTDGLAGGQVRMRGNVSSQFLSGLLMAAPLARDDITIDIEGMLVSRPYIAMTLGMMQNFGVHVEKEGANRLFIPGNQCYRATTYEIEPDASAASYFFAAAAITQGDVRIVGLTPQCLQGDFRFTNILYEMGCYLVKGSAGTRLMGWPLHGIDTDMIDISDCVMTLAAVACFADGPTTIRNVAHIRHKESDRVQALATELRKVGAKVDEFPDGLKITPGPLHGAEIETYNDHRIAMSMALIGLKVPGIVIRNPGCVAKTYPGFFDDLERLR